MISLKWLDVFCDEPVGLSDAFADQYLCQEAVQILIVNIIDGNRWTVVFNEGESLCVNQVVLDCRWKAR